MLLAIEIGVQQRNEVFSFSRYTHERSFAHRRKCHVPRYEKYPMFLPVMGIPTCAASITWRKNKKGIVFRIIDIRGATYFFALVTMFREPTTNYAQVDIFIKAKTHSTAIVAWIVLDIFFFCCYGIAREGVVFLCMTRKTYFARS